MDLSPLSSLLPLSVTPASPDNDVSTAQTVELMRQYARAAMDQPPVVAAIRQALAGLPHDAPVWRKAQAIHSWIRQRNRFAPHEDILEALGRSRDEQLLIPPYLFLRFRSGDCAMYTMLACAMLLGAGVPCEIVTVAAGSDDPWRWSHVYAVAYQEDGSELPVDVAAAAQNPRLGLGWQVPNPYRRQEWPA